MVPSPALSGEDPGAARTAPRVRVIVVNHEGGEMTLACLRSLLASDWSELEIVLVDNGSTDDVVARARRELPSVEVRETGRNLGFGGACNRGLVDLAGVDHVALVNNDARVDPGWLVPLVECLEGDPSLGAACPKILFEHRFRDLWIEVAGPSAPTGAARLEAVWVGVHEVLAGCQLVRGFLGPDRQSKAQRFTGRAELLVPTPQDLDPLADPATASVGLHLERGAMVTVGSGGARRTIAVGPGRTELEVELAAPSRVVVNNAGCEVLAGGYVRDRGWLEADPGSCDDPVEVDAWSGGGVLARRAYLEDVGPFDERLFLYYEDVDLSLRGRRLGWRYRYAPRSVLHHRHSATIGQGSELAQYHNERNRLVVLLRHQGVGATVAAVVRHLLVTVSYARRDVLLPLMHGGPVHPGIVRNRLRALLGFLPLVAGTVARRRRDLRRRRPT